MCTWKCRPAGPLYSNLSTSSGKPEVESLLTAQANETDVVDDRQTATTSQAPGIRKRSLSSSSGNKVPSIRRQHSNPAPHRDEEKAFRKSKTFSNFTSVLSGQKGTPEETKPMLSTDDDGHDVVMINMKYSGQRNNQERTAKTVKIECLNAHVYRTVCNKLNLNIDGKDWKTLAGKMGYSNEFVKQLQRLDDPADGLLAHWGTKSRNDVTKLIELLLVMERSDITEQLESEHI